MSEVKHIQTLGNHIETLRAELEDIYQDILIDTVPSLKEGIEKAYKPHKNNIVIIPEDGDPENILILIDVLQMNNIHRIINIALHTGFNFDKEYLDIFEHIKNESFQKVIKGKRYFAITNILSCFMDDINTKINKSQAYDIPHSNRTDLLLLSLIVIKYIDTYIRYITLESKITYINI